MRDCRGFTLIELLVVVGIVAILAAIAAPSMSGFVRKNRIQNQTIRIYNDIMNTRIMAMNTNRMHFVEFGLAGNQYRVVEDTDGNNANNAGASDTVRLARTAMVPFTYANIDPGMEAIEIQAGGFTNNLVTFDSRGIATGLLNVSGGAICIPSVNLRPNTNCIVVTPTRIRMGKYSGAAGGCNAAACN
ncbi:MAG: putative major pilin subunit [Syntrophorhabdus sp. PtaB.Bin047]|jgi:prepilin-type N-terminal cleavage/methylation domain-containing protein|nr:MAG: putative major pilin subunit [Syntrophorhabdus sp. PtaB.Bin047]